MLIVDSCTLHKNITVWTKLHIIIFQFVSIWHDKCYKIWLDWMSNVKIWVKIHLLSIICLLTLTCYILYFKKTPIKNRNIIQWWFILRNFDFMVSSKRFWKQTWKEQKSMSCRIIKIRRGWLCPRLSVFQRFMGAFMFGYTCLIKKIIMYFKILFLCKFTVKRVKRITTKLWSLSSKI